MLCVKIRAVHVMSKRLMVQNKREATIGGDDRTQQNLNNPHLMGLLQENTEKKVNVIKEKLKAVLKTIYILAADQIFVNIVALHLEFLQDLFIKILI